MGEIVQGIPASPGIVTGPAYPMTRPRIDVPHATVSPERVEDEVRRFSEACDRAKEQTRELREQIEREVGVVQAKIFDPQLLMLDDPDLVDGTLTYIRESYLTAERAFRLRVLEFRSHWLEAAHARVVDRVADLADVESRVLSALLDLPPPHIVAQPPPDPVVLLTDELTPSLAVQLNRERVLGVAIDTGTRTSHASILARSLKIPVVVGLGSVSRDTEMGTRVILDGHRGRLIVEPSEAEMHWFRDRNVQARASEEVLKELAELESVTEDGTRIELLANLELPSDAEIAARAGADGVGLFRTEFLAIGKSSVPGEPEQYEAFRLVTETFAPRPVVIRTYDLGGDKFPMFLPPLSEENPFLGWRGIRLYLEMPDLFRNQIRAVLRAAAHGNVRILIPMVSTVEEIESTREIVNDVADELNGEGVEHATCPLGIMLETPAAVAMAEVLGRHVDFFSLGTNDLVQYALAVDRGNARLARYYDPYHPAVVRLTRDAIQAAQRLDVPISVCGETASDALGAFLMIGLGVRTLSCAPSAIPEMKRLVRSLKIAHAEEVARTVVRAETGVEVRNTLIEELGDVLDLSTFTATPSLSRPE